MPIDASARDESAVNFHRKMESRRRSKNTVVSLDEREKQVPRSLFVSAKVNTRKDV